MRAADKVADVLPKLEKEVEKRLTEFSYDLRPTLGEAFQRIAKPHRSAARRRPRLRQPHGARRRGRPHRARRRHREGSGHRVAPCVTHPLRLPEDRAQPLPPLANVATIPARPVHGDHPRRRPLRRAGQGDGPGLHQREALLLQGPRALPRRTPRSTSAKDQLVLKSTSRAPSTSSGSNLISTATST